MEKAGVSIARGCHLIRRFRPGDAAGTRAIFYRAVHVGAAEHYSELERVDWVQSPQMPEGWGDWLERHITFVSELGGQLTGFMMLERSGYLNMAFILPEWRRSGLADQLYANILAEALAARMPCLTVLASRMAARFLARHHWQAAPELAAGLGQSALNHAMKLQLVKS